MRLLVQKTPVGLAPLDDSSDEWLDKQPIGSKFKAEVTKPRNYKFLQKFHVLINIAFDLWEPPHREHNGIPVEKNRERFRKDLTIAAGFYEPVYDLRGQVRGEAKSIAFANMDETEFAEVYDAILAVIIKHVTRKYSAKQLDEWVMAKIEDFS